jgi:hypothetical protein
VLVRPASNPGPAKPEVMDVAAITGVPASAAEMAVINIEFLIFIFLFVGITFVFCSQSPGFRGGF